MEEVNLNAQGLKLIRHRDGPLEIRLPEEDSQLWRALKEHLGNKDPVWRNIANWRRALLEELQAQAALNRAIKAQGILGLLVFAPSSEHSYSTTSLVNLVRVEVIRRALGEPPTSAFRSARVGINSLPPGDYILPHPPQDADKAVGDLSSTVEAMTGSPEGEQAARARRKLEDSSTKAREEIEAYLLLHYIPGRCSLCKKLGGQ
jgi:hypothetical protein